MAFGEQAKAKAPEYRWVHLESVTDGGVYPFRDDGESSVSGEHSATRQHIVAMLQKMKIVDGKHVNVYSLHAPPKLPDPGFDARHLQHKGQWNLPDAEWKAVQVKLCGDRSATAKVNEVRAAALIEQSDGVAGAKKRAAGMGAT